MAQLLLQTPGVLAHQLDQALDRFLLEDARRHLEDLCALLPQHPGYHTAYAVVALLRQTLGPRFPSRPQRLEAIADAWDQARSLVGSHGLSWQLDPLARLAASYHRRFGDLLDRLEPGTVFRDVPAGWHHLEAGRLETAVSSLSATVQNHPLDPDFRRLLADARSRLAPGSREARAAWFGALLAGPLKLTPAHFADPAVTALEARARELELPGDPRAWMAAVGLCEGVFDWDMLPGAPLWDGTGVPAGLSGQPGAFLTFLGVLEKHRRAGGPSNWQLAEAKRQLHQLAPRLYAAYLERRR